MKECLEFMVKTWIMIVCMSFSKNVVPKILCLVSITAKGNMKYLDFVSIDEKQVTEIYYLIGTSDWFAIVMFFDESC